MENVEQTITTASRNPLMDRVKIPGETIRLPSGGIFYKNGELNSDVKNGEIHVYPLTAMSEILLRSPDMILNGEALTAVLNQCTPQIAEPMKLLSKDIDYLMTALRKVTYGDSMEIKYQHDCENAKEHSYTIQLSRILASSKPIDPTELNSTFTMSLPNGQALKLQPMRFSNVVEIMQSANAAADNNTATIGKQLIRSVSFLITSVDEITDNEMIVEWLSEIPVSWFNDISKAIEQISDWGPDFHYTTVCKDCGQEVELSLTLNPLTFFM